MNTQLGYGAPTWDEVVPLLVGFHRVVSMNVVQWVSLNAISAQTWLTLGRNFSRVESLFLTSVKDNDISSLARVLCAFPCLRKLSIRMPVNSTIPELSSATTFRLSPHLHTLDLRRSVAAVLEWLLSLPVRPALRTVYLDILQDEDLATFHKFIGVFGNGLKSLSLSSLIKDRTLPYLI
jgi:hypothetical protein